MNPKLSCNLFYQTGSTVITQGTHFAMPYRVGYDRDTQLFIIAALAQSLEKLTSLSLCQKLYCNDSLVFILLNHETPDSCRNAGELPGSIVRM